MCTYMYQKYIRAHFNYNGKLDEEIPCKSLGLSFRKGDILEISNQDDPNWWQVSLNVHMCIYFGVHMSMRKEERIVRG